MPQNTSWAMVPSTGGPLGRGERLGTLLADEHHLVADGHVVVGTAVHHDLVHGDHPRQRAAPAADQHLPPPVK